MIGPGEPIPIPTTETKADYEVEPAMVIGRQGKRLSDGAALDYVFGWTILHDVSARDVYLKPGDEVTVSVDRIGNVTNPVVAGW